MRSRNIYPEFKFVWKIKIPIREFSVGKMERFLGMNSNINDKRNKMKKALEEFDIPVHSTYLSLSLKNSGIRINIHLWHHCPRWKEWVKLEKGLPNFILLGKTHYPKLNIASITSFLIKFQECHPKESKNDHPMLAIETYSVSHEVHHTITVLRIFLLPPVEIGYSRIYSRNIQSIYWEKISYSLNSTR